METLKTQIQKSGRQLHLSGMLFISALTILLTVSLFSCTVPYMVGQNPDMVNVAPPSWAPEYDNSANYYYLPDIECYYDVRNRLFVYLQDGNWRFEATLPSVYASFDLNNSYVVFLNNAVNEPWMHFQYYVAHYPRYYYKSVDRDRYTENGHRQRWFNENLKHSGNYPNRGNRDLNTRTENRREPAIKQYRNEGRSNNRVTTNERNNNRVTNNQGNNKRVTTDEGNRKEVRQNADNKQIQPQRKEGAVRQEQPMKYYGRQVGQPVKVLKNMRKPQEKTSVVKQQDKREKKQ